MKYLLTKYSNFFLVLLWIYFISSINSPPFHELRLEFSVVFNFIRGISPLIILIFMIFFIIYFQKFKNLSFNFYEVLIIIYFFSQILSHIYFNKNIFSLDIYWPVTGISLILFLNLSNTQNSQNLKNFNYTMFILISIFCAITTLKIIKEFYLDIFLMDEYYFNSSWYSASAIAENTELYGQEHPRSSGYGRMLCILFIYLFLSFVYMSEPKLNDKNIRLKKNIHFFLVFFVSFCIWHVQNRSVLLFLLCFIIFFLLPFDYLKLKNKFKILSFFILIPFLLHLAEPVVRIMLVKEVVEKREIKVRNLDVKEITITEEIFSKKGAVVQSNRWIKDITNQSNTIKDVTSGRWTLWIGAIDNIKRNPLGYGPQADRKLLNQNVSNLFLYSFLCGGVIGFISILIFYIFIIYRLLMLVFKYKLFKEKNNLEIKFSFFIISFFMVRSLFEVSFGIFGIDMIFFFLSLLFIEKYLNRFKKIVII